RPDEWRAEAAAPHGDEDVVDHAHRAEQLGGLVSARYSGARDAPAPGPGEFLLCELYAAGVGPVEAADHVEHGGFAGAVGTDQAEDVSGLRAQAHVGRGYHAAKVDADALHLEGFAGGTRQKDGKIEIGGVGNGRIDAAQPGGKRADDAARG